MPPSVSRNLSRPNQLYGGDVVTLQFSPQSQSAGNFAKHDNQNVQLQADALWRHMRVAMAKNLIREQAIPSLNLFWSDTCSKERVSKCQDLFF